MPQPEIDIIEAPALNVDAVAEAKYGHKVSAQGRLERRIVANLIAHLEADGFKVSGLYDGLAVESCNDAKSAMELIFNLDEAWLRVCKPGFSSGHQIALVMGNGIDIISDWSYSKNDADGFNAAMDAFDAERCLRPSRSVI